MSADMNAFQPADQTGLVRRITGFARTVGMSAMLTMRLFDTYPEREPRDRAAIVRHLSLPDEFDPREILPNGVVLTMPYILDQGPDRCEGIGSIHLN